MAKITLKLFLTMLLASFLVTCDLFDFTDLEEGEFYALDMRTKPEKPYTLKAKKLAEGEKCVIWAENGSGVDEKKAKEIAAEYDINIRQKIVGTFGMKDFTVDGKEFDDILDYANWLVGKKDKKLTILLLDIKDNFNLNTKNYSYVAGYFYSGNFYRNGTQGISSNECDMIYVDTYPSLDSSLVKPEQTFTTFAHELQHLINFTTTWLKRKDSVGRLIPMDSWIDEGLSSQAEQIYLGENIKEHCTRFNKSETIAKGNNFFVWGEKPDAILDEYATVYLFFRWLYLQAVAKGRASNLFLDIATSNSSDYSVITNVAEKINSNWTNWDTVLRYWLAANYYPDNSDYGYKDDYFYTGDTKIKVKPLSEITSTPLYPGEGVYSIIKDSSPSLSPSGNIRYATLDKGAEKALLTFNVNTNSNKNTAEPETGNLTGVKLPVSASVSSAGSQTAGSRMVTEDEQTPTGPYRIDARDYAGLLGRNK